MINTLLEKARTAKTAAATQLRLLRVQRLDGTDDDAPFPAAETALDQPNGLIAIGGNLSPRRLEQAYRQGIFPWFQPGEPIRWWSPDPRAVTLPESVRISKKLRSLIRRREFGVTFDSAFREVVLACAAPRAGAHGTWISEAMIEAYCRLFDLGSAHSLEVWRNGQLVGGLYGVSFGAAFFGESMFSRTDDASKIGFVYLARQLHQWNYQLIDGQFPNRHMSSLGAITIPRHDYLQRLAKALAQPGWAAPWRFTEDFNPLLIPAATPSPVAQSART